MPNNASTDSTIDLLNDVAEFLEGQADVRDGSDGPRPNKAMELMARAEIEIERLKRASLRGPSEQEWLEDELVAVMQTVAPGMAGMEEDDIIRLMVVTSIRRMIEADTERYEALLDRWQARQK
jgi:hypothetical protein